MEIANKKQIRDTFVQFVTVIAELKRLAAREEYLDGQIGAMQMAIDALVHEKGEQVAAQSQEVMYYMKQINELQQELDAMRPEWETNKNAVDEVHATLARVAFVGYEDENPVFALPHHSTKRGFTWIPGYSSLVMANPESVEFMTVERALIANRSGEYLVYPTMGKFDYQQIL